MPRGDKSSYTSKQKRQAEHIEKGYEREGVSKDEAERRAWATVNKSDGGGKKSGSGRGKKRSKASARKGGKKAAANKKKKAAKRGGKKKAAKRGGKKKAAKRGTSRKRTSTKRRR
jgi:plasmid stabilization system protein ParE